MEFTEFKEKAAEGMQAFLGEEVRVELNRVRKNNGVVLDGIVIGRDGINISPTIYLNDFYKEYRNGKCFSAIIKEMADLYEQAKMRESMNMEFFLDYEQVRGRLVYRLVNYEKNRDWLRELPHIPYLDMALTFQCLLIQDDMGNATIQITREHCRMWNVDEKELYRQARSNTEKYLRATITGMKEVVRDMIAESLEEELVQNFHMQGLQEEGLAVQLAEQMLHAFEKSQDEIRMYVLSNHTRIHGAAAMLYNDVLREFAEEQEHNLYILPSSVHEVILVPDSGRESPEKLRAMVQEVNRAEVDCEEQLSDSVYYYDRIRDVIALVE